jgi:DNA repair exonuclease SbcCD nuclease subunit
LGDIVDRRKYVNIHTASRMREDFLDPLKDMGIVLHIIPGNHDVYYKDSNRVNVLKELVEGRPDTHIYYDPTEVDFGNTKVLMVPWICAENEKVCLNAIKKTKAPVVFGHLALQGFEMHRGSFCEDGHDANIFERFDKVLSGHFHHKSTYYNINYLGNPFEMTWNDYNDAKGFHLFNTDTRELKYISNPFKLFKKVHYNDEGKQFKEVMNINFNEYANSYVKVIVGAKTNPYLYDSFIQKLESVNPIDLKAVDDHLNLALENDNDIINQTESTLDILTKTIPQSNIPEDYQNDLATLFRNLYADANLIS